MEATAQVSAPLTRPMEVRTPLPRGGVDWSIALPLLLAHLICLAMPWTFTWAGLVMFVCLYLLSGLGVTLGAHRYFTHRSFKATSALEGVLSVLFLLSAQGSLGRWVRDHHIHHRHSDHEGDPHSPHGDEGGFWYAQFTWLWRRPPSADESRWLYQSYKPRLEGLALNRWLCQPPVMLVFHLLVIGMVYLTGWLVGGVATGISCVVWGIFGRIVCVLHATSLVNSAAHLWGYRTYGTPEHSRNNWWVAIVSLGEGWHNNHHGRPASANQGFHGWWEFDLTFCFLLLLGALGQARDVRVYRHRSGKTETWFPSEPLQR